MSSRLLCSTQLTTFLIVSRVMLYQITVPVRVKGLTSLSLVQMRNDAIQTFTRPLPKRRAEVPAKPLQSPSQGVSGQDRVGNKGGCTFLCLFLFSFSSLDNLILMGTSETPEELALGGNSQRAKWCWDLLQLQHLLLS